MGVCIYLQAPEQFIGVQLERICYVGVQVVHALDRRPMAGCKLKVYDVTSQQQQQQGEQLQLEASSKMDGGMSTMGPPAKR